MHAVRGIHTGTQTRQRKKQAEAQNGDTHAERDGTREDEKENTV